jgi:hypothetical protein
MSQVRSPVHRVTVIDETEVLAGANYAGAFEVTASGADGRSPEQWVRDVFEGAPRAFRRFVVVGWRYVVGLRLGPWPSPDHVLGWRIVSATSEMIILEVRSAMVTARKTLRVEGSRVTMTTFVRYERPLARAIWAAIAPVHHQTEPYLLGHAASHQCGVAS